MTDVQIAAEPGAPARYARKLIPTVVIRFARWLFEKPHFLGWLANMLVIFGVGAYLIYHHWDEQRTDTLVLNSTVQTAERVLSPSRSAYRSRTQQTSELSTVISRAWPLVIEGSDHDRALVLSGVGPLVDEYARMDAEWLELRTLLESDIPSPQAVGLVESRTAQWIANNNFYQGREPLFIIWIVLVISYSVFVLAFVMPKSSNAGKTESLLLLVDAGLYFTVISWFTKAEVTGLGWIMLAPASVVFFEIFRSHRSPRFDPGAYVAGLLFMFFLLFGVLQIRFEYIGSRFALSSLADALKDFLTYTAVAAVVAAGLVALFTHYQRLEDDTK